MGSTLFTNGVIAVKERSLLGDKLLRFTEMTAEEVLRALKESGFGGVDAEEGEALVQSEERLLDDFIREYAPSGAEREYLLATRDFHNAKAIVKAVKLGTDPEPMLAPDGLRPAAVIRTVIESGDYTALGTELGGAVKEALENETLTGAELGALFDKALYRHLQHVCKLNLRLKKLLAGRADRVNILTALRAGSAELAEKLYVGGGKLKARTLKEILDENPEKSEHALEKKPCEDFYKICLAAREKGLPYTEAERALESFESEYFYARRYELEGKEPFLYFVFRRRAEIKNVRIILVCLNAGLSASDIRKRLRAIG